ncbi:MAG: ATP-binding protein [Candidatus Micrarchaeia archaeon]|jgi:ATP-dependent Lon protease
MRPAEQFAFENVQSTASVAIPKNPLEQVVGQEQAVKIARMAAGQKRNLLLVGPPGVGKSMLAQALAYCLPRPQQEISVLHNPENPERPIIEVRTREQIARERKMENAVLGRIAEASEVPPFVAERLGLRCRRCGRLSPAAEQSCPNCGLDKHPIDQSPFGDLLSNFASDGGRVQSRVHTTRNLGGGREEIIVYERWGEKVRVLDQHSLERLDESKRKKPRKVLVPLGRKTFINATGASETELLGDVRHDPYGGHPQIGVQPYSRVVAGAIHEAHEGVLFVDELATMQYLQRFILTAMQERKYAIVGKNPQSSGASVRVDDVPCDFILIAASNINDIQYILPPLRSRILGNGYEVLLKTTMPDNAENRQKLLQFIAQEIRKDGKIPHATMDAAGEIINEARRRAKVFDDDNNSLTLRLRDLSGIIHLAGDVAKSRGGKLIDCEDVRSAIIHGRNIEEQLAEKYGSVWKAGMKETNSNAATANSAGGQKEIS